MRTSEKLDFVRMCKMLPTYNKKRNRREKLEEVINSNLKELGERIYEYGGGGELTIKFKMKPDTKRDKLNVTVDVATKLPT